MINLLLWYETPPEPSSALLLLAVRCHILLLLLYGGRLGCSQPRGFHPPGTCFCRRSVLPGGRATWPCTPPMAGLTAGLLPGFRSAGWSVWLLTMVWAGWHGWDINSNDLASAKCATVEMAPRYVWKDSL